MIAVVIKGPTIEEAKKQIRQAIIYKASLVELRLDIFQPYTIKALNHLLESFPIPMIFKGGKGEEIKLRPEFIDIDHQSKIISSDVKQILSYHNFKELPDLEFIYSEMKKTKATYYKLAVTPKNSLEALKILSFARGKNDVIAIGMGEYGQITRILSPWMGCPFVYACLDGEQIAPGQLSIQELVQKYHFHTINKKTELYGLIGDPVEKSISDETHNHWMKANGLNAVYVKMLVTKKELPEFLNEAKQLFSGLSVTMPLKEAILPFIEKIDPEALKIGAVNTLLIKKNQIVGFNTDGKGAMKTINKEFPIEDKKIVILGAGGAAKAIAYEAVKRGADVTIINRDKEKALSLAKKLFCKGGGLNRMITCAKKGYDLLINCTPSLPISDKYILPNVVVMDIITKPKETHLIKVAESKGCRVIYGYKMFLEQAFYQFNHWFIK